MKLSSLFRFLRKNKREMTCEEAKRLSSDYIEGELPESFVARFRFHLDHCQNCIAFVATLRATVNTLRGLPHRTHPPGLEQQIIQKIHRQGDSSDSGSAKTEG